MIKRTAIFAALLLALSGCATNVDIDELISAKELPEYEATVEIEVNEDGNSVEEPIDIDG